MKSIKTSKVFHVLITARKKRSISSVRENDTIAHSLCNDVCQNIPSSVLCSWRPGNVQTVPSVTRAGRGHSLQRRQERHGSHPQAALFHTNRGIPSLCSIFCRQERRLHCQQDELLRRWIRGQMWACRNLSRGERKPPSLKQGKGTRIYDRHRIYDRYDVLEKSVQTRTHWNRIKFQITGENYQKGNANEWE